MIFRAVFGGPEGSRKLNKPRGSYLLEYQPVISILDPVQATFSPFKTLLYLCNTFCSLTKGVPILHNGLWVISPDPGTRKSFRLISLMLGNKFRELKISVKVTKHKENTLSEHMDSFAKHRLCETPPEEFSDFGRVPPPGWAEISSRS